MDDRTEHQISPTDPILTTKVHAVEGRPWQSGLLKHLPWTGLLSLLAAILCGVGAIVVAHDFDDKLLDHWTIRGVTVQPTVLLSVLATVSKACLGYAFATGITISWWRSAVVGTSLHQLHVSHQQSNNLQGLFGKRPKLNSVAVASVATLLLMAEGPLLQRALHVVTRTRQVDIELTVPISSSPLMTGRTSFFLDGFSTSTPQLYTPSFAQIVQQYNARQDIVLPEFGCQGTCVTDIVAAGWDIECSTNASDYRLMSEIEYASYLGNQSWTGTPAEQIMFATKVTRTFVEQSKVFAPAGFSNTSGNNQIGFDTMYKATAGIRGTIMRRSCTLSEATTHYRVEIKGRTVTLLSLPQMPVRTLQKTQRLMENPESLFGDLSSTFGGLWLALRSQYEVSATISFGVLETNSTNVSLYMREGNTTSIAAYDVYWADPIDDMISMLQELTFRTTVSPKELTDFITGETRDPSGPDTSVISPNLTATNRTVEQQAVVSMTFDETVYAVRYSWLIGAIVLIVLACLAILPTYRGWWLLGRPVSVSPLEIAKAFDAPLLRGVDANGTSKELARAIGDVRVRYEFESPSEARLVGDNYEMDPLHDGVSAYSSGVENRSGFGFRRISTGHEIL
jgi:hypothetical protein